MTNDRDLIQAMKLFKAYEGKTAEAKTVKNESWRGKPPIPILMGASTATQYGEYLDELESAGDLNDEELLKKFADQVLTYIKIHQPQLLQALKATYFEGLE